MDALTNVQTPVPASATLARRRDRRGSRRRDRHRSAVRYCHQPRALDRSQHRDRHFANKRAPHGLTHEQAERDHDPYCLHAGTSSHHDHRGGFWGTFRCQAISASAVRRHRHRSATTITCSSRCSIRLRPPGCRPQISLHRFAASSVVRRMLMSSSPKFRVSIRCAKRCSRRAAAFRSTISLLLAGQSTLISGTIGRLTRRA